MPGLIQRISRLLAALGFTGTLSLPAAETTLYINKFFEVRDHDQPVKYVFNGDTRVARVTGSLSTTARIQRIRLHPGWNLRSVAVEGATLPGGAGDQDGRALTAAYRWNEAADDWLSVSTNDLLAAGSVLWLHATTNATIGLQGTYVTPTNRPVALGPSFLPGAGLEAVTLPASGIDIDVWHHDAATQGWHLRTTAFPDPESAVPRVLAPGDAVFVNNGAPFDLQVPESALRVQYYHPDHVGSSAVMSDAAGALVEETAFYPFGFSRNEHRPRQVDDAYGYTQKERDRESGLHYFGARYLVSALARFASVDPKYVSPGPFRVEAEGTPQSPSFYEEPQLHNLYALAAGNPLKFTDPDGREVTWSKALQKDKSFQRAYKILENTQEGQRIIAALESAAVSVDVGTLQGETGAHAVGHHHGRAEFSGSRRNMRREATSVITIDLAKARRLKLTPQELANVLHHELRHAEIHNTVQPGEDYTTDAGIKRAEAVRNKADKALDVYIPYNGQFKTGVRRGTGVQSLDERSIDFQKEVGLLPPDYSQNPGSAAQSTKE